MHNGNISSKGKERKANKKNNDKQNKRSRDDGSSFSGMDVRLNDEKKKLVVPASPRERHAKLGVCLVVSVVY